MRAQVWQGFLYQVTDAGSSIMFGPAGAMSQGKGTGEAAATALAWEEVAIVRRL
jgi:hypothetical protein